MHIPKAENNRLDIVVGPTESLEYGISNNVWLEYKLLSVILLMKALWLLYT